MKVRIISGGRVVETIENKYCDGKCLCHCGAIQMGELNHGCCAECGCPKNKEGLEYFKKQYNIAAPAG